MKPFQPFLQMVHESGLPKPDKLYFLNRIVNHYAGEGETGLPITTMPMG